MKILQLNCVYRSGSTGRIVFDLHTHYVAQGHESYVIYGRGERLKEPNVYKCAGEIPSKCRNLLSRWSGNIYGGGKLATWKIIRHIQRIQPNIVHIHCLNGYCADLYMLLRWLRDHHIATVITQHAEFMYTGNCGYAFECQQWENDGCTDCPDSVQAIGTYNRKAPAKNWKRMKESFNGFHDHLSIVGVSDWISRRAARSTILKDKVITTVLNGLDDNVFQYKKEEHPLIQKYHEQNKKVVLHVTPYFEDANKGGEHVLKLASLMKDQPIQFVVAGMAKNQYDLPNVTFIGKIAQATELATLYSSADACLLTSKRETFSMVCAESLCCGTPIIGFCAGAPETIALPEYSKFVPYGQVDLLQQALLHILSCSIDKEIVSQAARAKYSYHVMAENYLKVYEDLLRRMKKDEQD